MIDLRQLAAPRRAESRWSVDGHTYYSFEYSRSSLFVSREASDRKTGILAGIWAACPVLRLQADDEFAELLGARVDGAFVLDTARVVREQFWRYASAGYWTLWSDGHVPAIEVPDTGSRSRALVCAIALRGGWVIWAGPDADEWLVMGRV